MGVTGPHTWRLRARLLVLGVVLVAFDAVAVAVAYGLAHLAAGLAPLLWSDPGGLFSVGFGTGLLVPVVVVGTPLVLVAQSVFGYRMTVREGLSGATDPSQTAPDSIAAMRRKIDRQDAVQSVRERVDRLAHTADMAPPDVSIVESETPNSFVASRPGERTLVVTTALVEVLADEELDAVLAHELAHLKHGDSVVMTAAAFLPTVTDRCRAIAVGVLRRSFLTAWLFDTDDSADARTLIAGQFEIALVVFALAVLPVVAVLSLASTACYRLLSRIREYAADAGAVAICGSPAAMASALETLTTDHRPDSDLRAAETGVRELCVLPHSIEDGPGDSGGSGGVAGRIGGGWARLHARLLPGSHPDLDDRLNALRERQAAVDDADESTF
ncbi:M48 family metallopeptidase [Haloarcula montana]|uniref:M48 family metallopeptidase n=1 Tax=Haloarcula montana TaxID=3111776 RepID=UPI002D7A23DA|nr:M48 family metalloprotease [Haloarcula sp. GH36]